jgi:hypothetical protein
MAADTIAFVYSCRAWIFVASLTVCSAHFGRLRDSADTEMAIQQAEEILKHFSRHTKQGKRYGLILKRLSKAARDYVRATEQRERLARNIAMPELFSLKVSGSRGPRTSSASQPTWDLLPHKEPQVNSAQKLCPVPRFPIDSRTTEETSALPLEDIGFTDPILWSRDQIMLGDYTSISDILRSFNDNDLLTTDALTGEETCGGGNVALEDMDYIWGLNWGNGML